MPEPAVDVAALFRKVRRRLIPFLFLLYVVAYLDRVNVGFAALQMNRDLSFSAATYGLGAGIFFVGYTLFEVPSNLLLERVGARLWIARIMIVWGIVSASMMFSRSASSFYVLRFLLGVAEAGFFPGMLLYLTRWFPADERARAVAQFMTATAVAGIVGGPVSGALLSLDGAGGLAGWQWLLLLEGLPAVACGFAVLAWLPERPSEARWLTEAERGWLDARMADDERARAEGAHSTLAHALSSGRVWLLALVYFAIVVAFYGVSFWLPQIVRNMSGASDFLIGCISAVPYLAAAAVMTVVASHSDRTGERRWHVAGPALAGTAGLLLASTTTTPGPAILMLSIAAGGIWGALGPFWTLPTAFLTRDAAAGGIALVNAIGNLGGFVGPFAIGFVRERTDNFALALAVLAVAPAVAAALTLRLPHAEPVVRTATDRVPTARSSACD